jgi:hypothetical protein
MTLQSLLSRVEAATGSDRGIDLEVARALVPNVVVLRHDYDSGINRQFTYWKYTASVDDCIALADRVLPNVSALLSSGPQGAVCSIFQLPLGMAEKLYSTSGVRPTPALAYLEAILAAKIALAEQEPP